MSVRVMGLVWDLDLGKAEKFLLLAMADHAHHDGSGVRPGVALLAHKTGFSVRSVQRYIGVLEELGLLEATAYRGGGFGRATVYRIRVDRMETMIKGDSLTPLDPVDNSSKGDIHDRKGDIHDTYGDTGVTPTIRTIRTITQNRSETGGLVPPRGEGETMQSYLERLADLDTTQTTNLTTSDNHQERVLTDGDAVPPPAPGETRPAYLRRLASMDRQLTEPAGQAGQHR
jgi:hypothetical protein